MRALALAAVLTLAPLAVSAEIRVEDAYARASSPVAKTGAAFMVLTNDGATDDRLVGVRTEAAERAELHTHIADPNGMMQMREIEGGIALAAGESHALQRGGDHVMLLGLTGPLEQGDDLTLVLEFEAAGELTIEVPVDNDRVPPELGAAGGMHGDHGGMDHGSATGN
ncbi:copper chaperone PCu(A)C [Litorisediminicola beolgyonensis]|uniref:Copper chaperone PCu(A)C n=1 Tax=Litorisediminicola beolgyonensis TaxID=1173614 RepID=A0ABW3ZLN3_9RHOB